MKNLLELLSYSKYYEFDLKNISLIEFLGDWKKEISYSSLKGINNMFTEGYYFKKEYSKNHFIIRGWIRDKYFNIELKYRNSLLLVVSKPSFEIYLIPVLFNIVMFIMVDNEFNFIFALASVVIAFLGIRLGNKRVLEKFDKDLRIKLLENKMEYKIQIKN